MNTPTLSDWLKNCPLPRLEARLLLQHVTGLSHAQILTRDTERLPETQLNTLQAAVSRRLRGEPVAYILGEREFYGRLFAVSPDVLIPRPETEHLVEAALHRLPENGRVWDLGTGSGIIAVTLACERPDADVWAADISTGALAVARQNAARFQAAVRFGQGSWYQAQPQPPLGSVDIIVSNPPYIEAHDVHLQQGDLRFEPTGALTDFADGLSAIRTIAAGAAPYLQTGGWLMFEHGYNQGAAVRNILQDNGFTDIETLPDLAGLDRVTLGRIPSAPHRAAAQTTP